MCPCVHSFKHDITGTGVPIANKFDLKHHCGVGKAALGFGVQIGSDDTYSSHMVIMEKTVLRHFLGCFFIRSFLYLQAMRTCIKSRTSSNFGQIRSPTAKLAALGRLKKSPKTYKGENVVATLAPSFLIGYSSFLQVTRMRIKA